MDPIPGSCLCGGVRFELSLPFRADQGMHKVFCAACGSSLFGGRWPDGDEITVRLGALDGDPGSRPQFHSQVGSRAPWDDLPEDGLPRCDRAAPA